MILSKAQPTEKALKPLRAHSDRNSGLIWKPIEANVLHDLPYVSAISPNLHDHDANYNISDIAIVSKTEIWAICKIESINVFLFKWDSRMDKDSKWAAETMLVGMVLRGFWDKSKVNPVRLPEKYSNFVDMFDEDKANRLPKYS